MIFNFKKKSKYFFYKNYLYKISVPIIIILLLTLFSPKKKTFEYKFYKNGKWKYIDLSSPFDFKIYEKKIINKIFLFNKKEIKKNIEKNIIKDKISKKDNFYNVINHFISIFINDISFLKKEEISSLSTIENKIYWILNKKSFPKIKNIINDNNFQENIIKNILNKNITLNSIYNIPNTEKLKNKNIKFFFKKGDKIIKKNEIIDDNKIHILSELKKEYEKKIWNKKKYYFSIIGCLLINSIIIFLYNLYIFYFQKYIYLDNKKINFLFFNILLISIITILILNFYLKILYIIPFWIIPVNIIIFFNYNISIITYLITILLLSLIVPNRLEFLFIQIITGLLILLTTGDLYKMKNILFTIIKVIITYIIIFGIYQLFYKGTIDYLNTNIILLFFINGFFALLIHPLIFIFEKLFNVTSNISLIELSDLNSPILRLLYKKAPGTLQHVLIVSNLAEAAAISIGANSLLAKIGSIYHDIGKIKNSKFFIENQYNIKNPHEKLNPKKSAKIILNHVYYGLILAKKYKLPNSIIDFIRTHHGDSIIEYFYERYKKKNPNIKIKKKQFQYPGPKPFSKETVIVMIADSLEAASKSIKNPSSKKIDFLVDKIFYKKKKENQLLNANITLKEIEKLKKVFRKKLKNIFHTRTKFFRKN
ncbi:HDIG domain-containing metalloprotein [Blattabacterium cuenoti]|uniref:HDIG domain-containing metalloprotein n=1 Tax=Blattabacterium cuenoti TaxID=1653831 RepID=UPI00163C02C5|nr:HDIG domain-containing metalloprotein [Blattabacterium cuenoti]